MVYDYRAVQRASSQMASPRSDRNESPTTAIVQTGSHILGNTLKASAKAFSFAADQFINHTITSSVAFLSSALAATSLLAFEKSKNCAAYVGASMLLDREPSKWSNLLWTNRNWSDYLPMGGSISFEKLVTPTKWAPPVWNKLVSGVTGIHDLYDLQDELNQEAFKVGAEEYLKSENLDPTIDEESLGALARAKSHLIGAIQDLGAAECERYAGWANTTALIGGALFATLAAATIYKSAKNYFQSKRATY